MSDAFLQISDPDDLAALFGLTYAQLAGIIYETGDWKKYTEFFIPKRGGGFRTIESPCWKLKSVQRKLTDQLYEVYSPKPSAHGFVRGRSIVTNARMHAGRSKSYVFNIDLRGYFDSIHFGRVRGLFEARPFSFNRNIATVLAQICCFHNSLPQGAPTSPIVANMITRKLDRQLEKLARECNATYSRYADDITFSFICERASLPREIIDPTNGLATPGIELARLIKENGFEVNSNKVRLASSSQHKEVTGLTVNQFPNVSRPYVRQVASMLYSWEHFGLEAAEREFNLKPDQRHRASSNPKSLPSVIRGKLAFLQSVRGADDSVYGRLARRYNALLQEGEPKLRIETHRPKVLSRDVFMSYGSGDKGTAETICATLEGEGVCCWIAPRDVPSTANWGEAIIEGLEDSRMVVLVLSSNANRSSQVPKEVERAVSKGLRILVFRIEDVVPSKKLEFHLSMEQWVDALEPPPERHLKRLAHRVRSMLQGLENGLPA